MQKNEILVFIPTYNERENVEKLYQEIKKYNQAVDILFCDDNSPDGTGEILDNLAQKDTSVHVIHRSAKLGLGTAHVKAFEFAQQYKYRHLITMDADFTHHPSYISAMLQKKDEADIVIGSRYAHGGSMSGWGSIRLPFTYFWRNMIKKGLGMHYDCTGAFRLYNVSQLKPELYQKFSSKGFSFCMESLYRMHQSGFKIMEVPIKAHNRMHGKSKLSVQIMKEVALTYFRLLFERKPRKK
ncbi:MAG: polyprenol monophosphomannose synthase [Candidatus Babeliales bacterium]